MDRNLPDQGVVENIALAIFRVQPMLRRKLQKYEGINPAASMPLSHVQVLTVLDEEGSMTVSDISRRFNIAKPNITPLVDRLSAEGLVERRRSMSDRRVVNISILEAGREKLRETKDTIYMMIEGWKESLSKEEFSELSAALDSMIRILSKV